MLAARTVRVSFASARLALRRQRGRAAIINGDWTASRRSNPEPHPHHYKALMPRNNFLLQCSITVPTLGETGQSSPALM
jgi:hypothetical protein